MPTDFPAAFAALRDILKKHSNGLIVLTDTPTDFTVFSPAIGPNNKPLWFGCVLLKKSAVTYHLMPLYFNPKLQEQIPAELLKRKQGKTCFNFQRPDPSLFAMLDTLTATGREHWSRRGLLTPGPISSNQFTAALQAGGTNTTALAKLRKSKAKSAAAKRAAALRRKRAK